jgi:hypothetical protein
LLGLVARLVWKAPLMRSQDFRWAFKHRGFVEWLAIFGSPHESLSGTTELLSVREIGA